MKIFKEYVDFAYGAFTLPKGSKILDIQCMGIHEYFWYMFDENETEKCEIEISCAMTGHETECDPQYYFKTIVFPDGFVNHYFVKYL